MFNLIQDRIKYWTCMQSVPMNLTRMCGRLHLTKNIQEANQHINQTSNLSRFLLNSGWGQPGSNDKTVASHIIQETEVFFFNEETLISNKTTTEIQCHLFDFPIFRLNIFPQKKKIPHSHKHCISRWHIQLTSVSNILQTINLLDLPTAWPAKEGSDFDKIGTWIKKKSGIQAELLVVLSQ